MMAGHSCIPFRLLSAILLLVGSLLIVESEAQLQPIVSEIETYIVHVDGIEDADLLSYEDRESWYMSFLPNTTLDSGEPRLLYSYRHVINGFAARLTREELKAMESMEGFVYAQPDRMRHLGTTYTPQFLDLNAYGSSVWAMSKGGEGVIIGVLDTGIVPDHPSFDDSGMPTPPTKWRGCCQFNQTSCNRFQPSFCNNKILGARSLFGSPLDENGHGSHVAGTAAGVTVYNAEVLGQAKGTAVGMAPRAHLAVYKVCSRVGCPDFKVLAAIEQAIDDGVDVLSLSITGAFDPFYSSGIMKGTFRAMEKKGILASCCAGNDGRIPFAISNDAPWVMTVGASTTDRVIRVVVELGNGMELYGQSGYQPENYSSPWLPIAYPGGTTPTDQKKSCVNGSLDDENVKGMMVLCGEMNSERLDKGRTVKEAQGAALIVLNQVWNGFTTWAEAHVLPAAHLSHVDSLKIVNYAVTEKNPKARLFFQGTHFGKRSSPAVIDISSRGPSRINGGILKPDIIGPGSNILAAWAKVVGPNASGPSKPAFNFATGCSMATPHLAGIAALLKSIHKDWSPAAIKSAIMTTADTLDHDGMPIVDEKSNSLEPASYFAMGAGHVNPSKAVDPGLVYDVQPEEYIRYLCSLYDDLHVKLIVKHDVRCYRVHHITAEQLNNPSVMVSLASSSEKNITRTVTYVGKEAPADYKLGDISEPKGTAMEIDPKELHFSAPNEAQTFTVKFMKQGSNGNQQYTQGHFAWVSGKHTVRSPVVVQHSDI